tara:strand:- start:1931 stop:2293 length:363 start_codon:yes stop_codon:yes gene_type:complete
MSNNFYWTLIDMNPNAIIWEEYEDAYLGVALKSGQTPVAVYDKKIVQGMIMENILKDEKFINDMVEIYGDNEEAITREVVKEGFKTFTEKIFVDTEGDLENRPIFLDIPFADTEYYMEEE